jgi:hypothetical protein
MPYKDPAKDRARRLERKEQINARRKERYYIDHEKTKAAHRALYKANARIINARNKRLRQQPTGWAKNTLSRLKSRAKVLGLEFNLTLTALQNIPKVCPVFGCPLELASGTSQACSVDRIDNARGYVTDNIVLLSDRANRLKRDASLSELVQLGEWAKKQQEKLYADNK